MNMEAIRGSIDRVVLIAATWLVGQAVAKGWIPASAAGDAVTAFTALLAVGWSIYINRPSQKAAIAAALPGVKVLVDPKEAPPTVVALSKDPDQPDILPNNVTVQK